MTGMARPVLPNRLYRMVLFIASLPAGRNSTFCNPSNGPANAYLTDMTRCFLRIISVGAAAWLAGYLDSLAATDALPHVYPGSLMLVARLGSDLFETLDPGFQQSLDSDPVTVQNLEAPVIMPSAVTEGDRSWGRVSISAGYVDLLNHIAHPKAIDHIQPGYFQTYILTLSKAAESDTPPEPPDIIDNSYWTDDVMNEQGSYFNQMIGMTLAINLSHHYLGHYNRFSSRMPAGQKALFNNLMPPGAWETEVKAATLNCLNCAVATGGAMALFEAIDKMPRRPAWAAYVAPPGANLKKLIAHLSVYEDQYFHGRLK